MLITEHLHSRPCSYQTTFTTDAFHNRQHSYQTRSLQSAFIAEHVHIRPHL